MFSVSIEMIEAAFYVEIFPSKIPPWIFDVFLKNKLACLHAACEKYPVSKINKLKNDFHLVVFW